MTRLMKSGELTQLVLTVIRTEGPTNIREILKKINAMTGNDYAYSTIATIVKRLSKKKMINSTEVKKNGRLIYQYSFREEAPREEIATILQSIIGRYGLVGIRHLGQVFNEKLSEDELLEIKKQFEESSVKEEL